MAGVGRIFIYGLAVVMTAFTFFPASADDNDVFGVSSAGVEPNILIIFDNSGSMSSTAVKEDCHKECQRQECVSWECQAWEEQCYKKKIGGKLVEVCEDVCVANTCAQWECKSWQTVCQEKTRMEVARETVKGIIDTYGGGNRFGIMIFHMNRREGEDGGYFRRYNDKYPVCEVKDTFILDDYGNLKTGEAYDQAISEYKAYLKGFVDTLEPETMTPLAETLAEAGLYFAEHQSWFNQSSSYYPVKGKYPDSDVDDYNPLLSHPPMEHRCRKNYIILMTDGEPTYDNSSKLTGRYINGEYIALDKSGQPVMPVLDDVAGFLHDNDINANFNTPDFFQNINVYAIGFQGGNPALLQDTADRGTGAGNNKGIDDGGLYFDATSPEDLEKAFETIMFNISERRTSFAAPAVPVSQINKAYAGKYAYLSLFQPSGEGGWIGNLKKYSLNDDGEFASCNMQTPVLDESGNIRDSAQSCWSDEPDGDAVDKGGAGERLSERDDSTRRIYANVSGPSDLTIPGNAFSKDNTSLEDEDFGVEDKDALIDRVRRVAESWRLGDLNHSRPLIVSYGSGAQAVSRIFIGSNDGMLHCFDDADGQETWAFVPREQFGRLKKLSDGGHPYFMDGSPASAETDYRKIVICGERRGGRHYYAIDVTHIDLPQYLYTHTADGQSWKTPQFMRIATGENAWANVFLMTGGYDTRVDDDLPAESGRSVYTINALTGEKEGFSAGLDDFEEMSCIVSASGPDMIDDDKSVCGHIYAADLAGHVYAFRDNDNPDDKKALDGQWQKMHLFSVLADGRKIFEGMDVVVEKIRFFNTDSRKWERVTGNYVYFGTGDRANPLRTDRTDWFYCVKNDWRTGPLDVTTVVGDYSTLDDDPGSDPDGDDDEPVILDVSDNKIQDGTLEERQAVMAALEADYNRGWCIKLEDSGEKCLSTPVVYYGIVYFTTYTPSSQASAEEDPCASNNPKEGISRLYALDYRTGAAVYDFSNDDILNKDDRYKEISQGPISIPPSPEIIISEDGPEMIDGYDSEDPKSDLYGARQFYWKIIE